MGKNEYGLTQLEQETVINYNAREKECTVCTAEPVTIRKLDKQCEKCPNDYKFVKQDGPYRTYTFSKKLISFRTPVKLTEEQRQRNIENLKKARKA